MAKRKPRAPNHRHPVNPALQNIHVQGRFPGFSFHRRNGAIIWRGHLQPRPTSPVYQIEIEYRLNKVPQVRVISPPLATNAKHLYKDKTLCLYWPKEWHWQQNNLIAEFIIPWAASWLYYYELWLDTGKWLGPSSHEEPK
ncbi:MAG: hypothetical protein MN733_14320 [Nitrososphaera sp.]|nr:hypothetical protein [Nitrososphaera sp.]